MKPILILKGFNEFYPNLNNKKYNIYKVDNEETQNFMSSIFLNFIDNQDKFKNQKHMIGIDFEFNKVTKHEKDIALMQINIENDSDLAYIFILYPPELTSINHKILINLITNKHFYKILHGAESLDIPYIFDQLLNNNDLINSFCSNFYDTRFLCDYYHIDNNINKRCSIYYLLQEHNIITQKKFDDLEQLTGPIYLINIDIHNLSSNILKYSLYDVIYLPEILKKFIKMGIVYDKIIPQISCIINKYKRDKNNIFNKLEKLINSMNLYFIYDLNTHIIFNDIYYIYLNTIYNEYLSKLYQIGYFKKFIEIILKFIIYQNILKYIQVWINNKQPMKNINWDEYWIEFNSYLFVANLLNDYNNQIINDIKKRIKLDI